MAMSHFEIWDRPLSESRFRPGRPGTVFREGRLFLFGRDSVTVARPWPPQAWAKYPGSARWRAARLGLSSTSLRLSLKDLEGAAEDSLHRPKETSRSIWAQALFLQAAPLEARRIALRFPDRHWHVLSVLARCPGADDLAASNPALLWALASSWVFHPGIQWPMRSVRRLIHKPQREALAWLGFPGTERTRKLFRKIQPLALTIPRLLYLRDTLASPDVGRMLAHVPTINAGVLRLATDSHLRRHVSPQLLDEVSSSRKNLRRASVARLLEDALQMLGVEDGDAPPLGIRSIRDLLDLHDNLVDDDAWLDLALYKRYELPSPPFPATPDGSIRPLASAAELIDEGHRQHNCIASYIPRISRGNDYVYRVTSPDRATVLLSRDETGCWRLREIAGPCNASVAPSTRAHVLSWLGQAVSPSGPEVLPDRRIDDELIHDEDLEETYEKWYAEEDENRRRYWPDTDWFDEALHFADGLRDDQESPVTREET